MRPCVAHARTTTVDVHVFLPRPAGPLCNIVTMECSSEVVVFACAYKRGVAGPNEIQNGGQIQTKTTSCITSQRITDITHSQSEYILGVADEYNP